MAFRDDIEAARARVHALQHEVAAARKRTEQDQARLYELELERFWRMPHPPPTAKPTSRSWLNDARIALGVLGWIGISVLIAIGASTPPVHPRQSWIVYPKFMLKKVARDSALTFLEAKGVDRDGNFHVHARGDFSLRTQGKTCEGLIWIPGPSLDLARFETRCEIGPARPIQCSPIAIRNRFAPRAELVSMRYLDGSWTVSSTDGAHSAVIADDCFGQFWPPQEVH
jgi:hypothetical protein